MVSDRKRRRAEELRNILIEISGVDPMKNSRKREYVASRTILARQLYTERFTLLEIAEIFSKDHTTIIYYLDKWRAFSMPGFEIEQEIWQKFKEKINRP